MSAAKFKKIAHALETFALGVALDPKDREAIKEIVHELRSPEKAEKKVEETK